MGLFERRLCGGYDRGGVMRIDNIRLAPGESEKKLLDIAARRLPGGHKYALLCYRKRPGNSPETVWNQSGNDPGTPRKFTLHRNRPLPVCG